MEIISKIHMQTFYAQFGQIKVSN